MNIERQDHFAPSNLESETRRILAAEFPFEHDVDLYFARIFHELGESRKGERLHAIGDAYHKHVFSRISASMSSLTDRIDFALTDIGILPALYAKEFLIAYLTYKAVSIARSGLGVSEKLLQGGETAWNTGVGAATVVAGVALIYGLNILRTPVEKKMGLERLPFDFEEELEFVINHVNNRANASALSTEELVPELCKAVDAFTLKYDGYVTKSAKRVKQSRFSNALINEFNIAALVNPYFQEIIITDPRFLDDVTHEVFHTKGIVQESQAQLASTAALIESGHPYLEYLGFKQWLDLLISYAAANWIQTHPRSDPFEMTKYLHEKRLNERTLREIQDRDEFIDKGLSQITGLPSLAQRTEKAIFARMPDGIRNARAAVYSSLKERAPQFVYFTQHPKRVIEKAFKNVVLKVLGEKDSFHTYISQPLGLLHCYRVKQLDQHSYTTTS